MRQMKSLRHARVNPRSTKMVEHGYFHARPIRETSLYLRDSADQPYG
jgi:hypothetical protein